MFNWDVLILAWDISWQVEIGERSPLPIDSFQTFLLLLIVQTSMEQTNYIKSFSMRLVEVVKEQILTLFQSTVFWLTISKKSPPPRCRDRILYMPLDTV